MIECENNQFQVWINGSYKGICNNLTVTDDAIVTAGMYR